PGEGRRIAPAVRRRRTAEWDVGEPFDTERLARSRGGRWIGAAQDRRQSQDRRGQAARRHSDLRGGARQAQGRVEAQCQREPDALAGAAARVRGTAGKRGLSRLRSELSEDRRNQGSATTLPLTAVSGTGAVRLRSADRLG